MYGENREHFADDDGIEKLDFICVFADWLANGVFVSLYGCVCVCLAVMEYNLKWGSIKQPLNQARRGMYLHPGTIMKRRR